MDDELQRQHRGHQDDKAVGDHLGQHDLRRHDRHDQKVLYGALLALTDQRRAGQDDGQERDLVDDLGHRREPRRLQVRVESGAHDEIDSARPLEPPCWEMNLCISLAMAVLR